VELSPLSFDLFNRVAFAKLMAQHHPCDTWQMWDIDVMPYKRHIDKHHRQNLKRIRGKKRKGVWERGCHHPLQRSTKVIAITKVKRILYVSYILYNTYLSIITFFNNIYIFNYMGVIIYKLRSLKFNKFFVDHLSVI